MTTKHTPGPWTVQDMSKVSRPRNKGLGWWRIRTAKGDLIADCRAVGLRITDAEIVANARLIAASPKMYDYINEKAKAGDEDAQKIINSI